MKDELIDKVKIENISLSNLGFVVFLKKNDSDKVLPIFIGAPEAHSIASSYNNHKPPRPLSHDLFKNILQLLDCKVTKIIITDLVENTFFCKIYLKTETDAYQIDSRPSDAIALALRFQSDIFVSKEVMESAAIDINQNNDSEQLNDVETMKAELDQAITEERYEDAASIRDNIKKLENDN